MLRIYPTILEVVRTVGVSANHIARKDRDLARQLRRAATSIALNTAEASGVSGGSRRLRHSAALGSAMEVRACLEVSEALGYTPALGGDDADRLDHVIATLYKLAR